MKPKATFRGAVIRPAPGARVQAGGQVQPRSSGTGQASAVREARVRVGREVAGRGGKGVSVITGLPLDEAGLGTLAVQLKKSCGAGGAVKDGKIEIQGDHRDKLVAALLKLGYDAKRSGG